MAKDPAFLFYPGDWNLGTMHMTLLDKGCYIELLMLQFARGKFTIAQAKHMLNGSFHVAWANISEKFATDGEFYWNVRLEEEKNKRKKFTESRRNNGLVPKTPEKHMHKHMEDENEDVNTINTNLLHNKLNNNAENEKNIQRPENNNAQAESPFVRNLRPDSYKTNRRR